VLTKRSRQRPPTRLCTCATRSSFDLAPEAVAYHRRVRDQRMAILMRGAAETLKAAHAAGAI
jgi:hypothetical protein